MKRKFLALLCIVALMVLSLASCSILGLGDNSGNNDDTCEHTYSDKWSTSTTHHWHAATCEHAELKTDVTAHTDADENGKCDVCDYELGHVHTFEDKWTYNDTHHWKVATCSHTDEKGELDVHTDSDRNAECDLCSAHVHVLNLNGDCTVCEEHVTDVDVSDLNVVLPYVYANAVNVVGGTIAYMNVITDLEMEDDELVEYYVGSYKDVVYVLGNGSAYYKIDTTSFYGDSQYTDSQENWYELIDEDLVFGVYQYTYEGETSDFEIDGTAKVDNLTGCYFSVSTLTDAYGAENLLATLYALSQSAAAYEYEYIYEDGVYTFGFAYLDVNSDTGEGEGDHVDYYEVGVQFTLSDNGTLTSLDVVCNCYTNSLEDELDNDYTYDQNAGTIELKETAVPDVYYFSITQEEGERTYVSEHPKSDFIPESFDAFVDAELTTQLGETVTITEGETLNVYFGNFLPETTDAKYLMDTFLPTHDDFNVSSWAYDGVVSFTSYTAGSYDIVFTLGGETFAFTLVVEAYVPDVGEQPENSVAVDITKDDTYAWSAVASFTAPADGDYTFYIPVGYGAWDKVDCDNNFSGAPYVDLYNIEGGIFTVSIKEGETYEFYVSYVEVGVVYITYTADDYTGSDDEGNGDAGVATEVVAGTYIGSNPYRGESTLVIDTANSTVSMDGQVFAYTFENGVMTLYLNGNAMPDYMLGVTLGSDGVPTAFVNNGNTYTVISGAGGGDDDNDDETVETVVEGTYTGTDMFGNAFLTVTVEGNSVTFTFNHPMMGPSSLNTTYAFVDGALVLYNEDGSELHPLAGSLTVDATGTPVSASYNGNDYTLTVGGSSEGGDVENPAEAVSGYYSMDGYEVTISPNYVVEGAYLFNAWNGTADIYYDLTVVDNGDGSYTLVLSLENPEEDVFGFLSEEFTVYVNGDDKVMYGPAIEVEIPDYEDITLGTHTVTLTTEMIDNGYVTYDFVVETDGFYSVTGITAIFSDAYDTSYGVDFAYLTAGNYVLKLSVWDAVEGDLEFTLANASLDSLTALQYLAAASGEYNLGELTYSIYTYGDEVYCVNIYNTDTWNPDVYYIVTELVKNEDGSISFVLALNTEISDSDDFGFVGTTVTVAYDYGFVLTHDVPLRVAQGTYIGTDMYGNAALTVVIDAETVTFTFEHPYMGTSTNVATYAIVDGAVVLYDELGNVINPLAGKITIDENGLPVAADFNGNNYTLAASGAEDDTDNGLQIGANFVTVNDAWMGTDVNFTAPETGTYNIYPGYGAMVGYDFNPYYFGDTLTVYLEAGQTIVLTCLTEDRTTGEISVDIELTSSDIGGGSTTEPDGTMGNPYVIDELPLEITHDGWHDVYYNFIPTEDCTLTITYTEGSYVSGLVNFDKDDDNNVYTVYCTAGEVVEINLWVMSASEVTYTYVISYAA